MTEALSERLRTKANMIHMGEKISFGSDSAIMVDAADEIDALKARIETTNSNLRTMLAIFRPGRDVSDADTDRLINLISGEIDDYTKRTSQYIEERQARIAVLEEALRRVIYWAESRCPMENDDPNPCPVCGASVDNLEACKSAESIIPKEILRKSRRALEALHD